jgi:SAM-dependent methyltransferase
VRFILLSGDLIEKTRIWASRRFGWIRLLLGFLLVGGFYLRSESFYNTVAETRFDTVICLNVVEHLDDDRLAMQNIAAVLNRGGRAIVLVPRSQWLYGSQDEVLGHKRRYSEAMIRDLGSISGLKLAGLTGLNKVSVLPWFINGRILRNKSFSRAQIFVLDLFIPLIRRLTHTSPGRL